MKVFQYEIKKICSRRSFKIVIGILFICLFVMMISRINSESRYVDLNGNTITGISAIKPIKEEKSKYNGILTENLVGKVIDKNRKINSTKAFLMTEDGYTGLNDKGYSRTQKYSDIRDLLNSSFCGFGEYNYYMADSLNKSDAKQFYSNRINKLKPWLDANSFNKAQKNYIINSYKNLKTPLTYSYMDGWKNLMDFMSLILYIVVIVICIISAQVFGVEYKNDAYSNFLTTKYGKSKGIVIKILSGLTITSLVYWATIIIFSLIILTLYGFDGASCMIQSNDMLWKSFYDVTNIQGFFMIVLLGYLGCLFMSSFTMFLCTKMKSAFGAIIISFIVIMAPAVLNQISNNETVTKILNVLPHQMVSGEDLLKTFNLFNVGDKVLNPFNYLSIIYILLSIAVLICAYKSFKKQQIN